MKLNSNFRDIELCVGDATKKNAARFMFCFVYKWKWKSLESYSFRKEKKKIIEMVIVEKKKWLFFEKSTNDELKG